MIRGLEVNPQPFQIEHLPVGDTSILLRFTLHPALLPTHSALRLLDLGLLLNTGFSADNTAARATKKARGMLFYL